MFRLKELSAYFCLIPKECMNCRVRLLVNVFIITTIVNREDTKTYTKPIRLWRGDCMQLFTGTPLRKSMFNNC